MKWLHTTRRRNKMLAYYTHKVLPGIGPKKKPFSQHNSYIEVYNARDIAEASVSKLNV